MNDDRIVRKYFKSSISVHGAQLLKKEKEKKEKCAL